MKVIIIGAIAAGASAAARLRRLDESAEIILLERGKNLSYANCGLPYHIGGVIPSRDSLLVMSAEKFRSWFNVDVRLQSEVVSINRAEKTITVNQTSDSPQQYVLQYDKLLIATGASPVTTAIPGSGNPRVIPLWTIADMDKIILQLKSGIKRVVVLGGGFVGLETAENLRQRGLQVTLVVRHQILAPCDAEMTTLLLQEMANSGIDIVMGQEPIAFEFSENAAVVVLDNGRRLETDLVIRSIGIKPNSELAAQAGLELGTHGHIVVNDHLQTSDPDIYAAGDVIEVFDPISGGKTAIALAGPANKQGRIAADNIAGRDSSYQGSFGASIIKIGNLSAGSIGLSEKKLKQQKIAYHRIYLHPASNAAYYPGGNQLHIKLLFDTTGKILGAQIVGSQGVDKRLDVIAAAMESGKMAPQLASLELSYAPPFNSAKDPVNFAGMIASNVLNGDSPIVHADQIPENAIILDVRQPIEFELGAIPGAINLPLESIREQLNVRPSDIQNSDSTPENGFDLSHLDKNRLIVTYCKVGMRGYLAQRILLQHGYNVLNLSGGYTTWQAFHPQPIEKKPILETPSVSPSVSSSASPALNPEIPTAENIDVLDVRSLPCPGPIVKIKTYFDSISPGSQVRILASNSFDPDLRSWTSSSGNELISLVVKADQLEAVVRKNEMKSDSMNTCQSKSACSIEIDKTGKSGAIVLFSNDLDKAMAAFIIACGMAASGMKVSIFFTFWGLSVLRKNPAPSVKKSLLSKMFGWMLPKGASELSLSKMNMGGIGTAMMKQVMNNQNVTSLPELILQAKALGVHFIACEMAMNVMGITREELIDVDQIAGVARFIELAQKSDTSLFI